MSDHASAGGADPGPFVRAFAHTRGRTRVHADLRLETLVVTVAATDPRTVPLEAQPVLVACAQPQSLAELVGLLGLPLGVVKVLATDLLDLGAVELHAGATVVDISLLDRVLEGVRGL